MKLDEKDKEKMTTLLETAKAIIASVWDETKIDEVGDVMCAIDEAVNAIENSDLEVKTK